MEKDFINIAKDTCIDKVDERDYNYSEILGLGERDRIYLIDLINDYQNQRLEEITKYMCVYFSNSHNSNIMNFLEGSQTRTTGKELGLEAEKQKMLDLESGTYLINGPKFLKMKGLISGYAKVTTLDEIKDSIFNNKPVSVGSNKIKWSEVKKEPFTVIEGKSYGHAFIIIGYNDDIKHFILKNSYGKDEFDNGRFYLKYENIDLLFESKYSLIDSPDIILQYNKKIMDKINIPKAKEAFEKGIWNGKEAKNPASREEVATMILRGLEKLKNGEI